MTRGDENDLTIFCKYYVRACVTMSYQKCVAVAVAVLCFYFISCSFHSVFVICSICKTFFVSSSLCVCVCLHPCNQDGYGLYFGYIYTCTYMSVCCASLLPKKTECIVQKGEQRQNEKKPYFNRITTTCSNVDFQFSFILSNFILFSYFLCHAFLSLDFTFCQQ